VPEGWKEAVPLQGDLAPDVEYRVYVSSGEAYIVRLDFSLGDLAPGTSSISKRTSFRPVGSLYERHALKRPEQRLMACDGHA